MLCPACQQDSSSRTICSRCGASLLDADAGTPTGDPFTFKSRHPALHRLKALSLAAAAGVAWILVFYLAYFRTARWSGGVLNAESSGYFFGSLAGPILVAAFVVWLIQRSNKDRMSAVHRHRLVAFLALGISLISSAGSLRRATGFPESWAKQRMGHLLKQAAGKEAGSSDLEWYEGPSREFFGDILKSNQEYTAAIQSLDRSSMNKLYTPESYATGASIKTTVSQLHALLDVDKKYESLDQLVKKLEWNISRTEASKVEKDEFLKGFRGSSSKALAPRSETFRAEEEWLQSSIDLYEFTLSHFRDYAVRDKKLIFRGDASRVQFQDLQARSIALRKAVVEAKHKLDAARQDAMSQTGITPADISSPASKEN